MKPTPPLFKSLRRLALTTKQTNKGYYKGTGTGSTGRHTKHGGFIVEYHKVRTYVVPPPREDFKLTPFVTKKLLENRGRFQGYSKGAFSGQRYLDVYKKALGQREEAQNSDQ